MFHELLYRYPKFQQQQSFLSFLLYDLQFYLKYLHVLQQKFYPKHLLLHVLHLKLTQYLLQ